ncbi:MAG: hypothetical protein MHPSP_002533 [Paramarteilia canceri]
MLIPRFLKKKKKPGEENEPEQNNSRSDYNKSQNGEFKPGDRSANVKMNLITDLEEEKEVQNNIETIGNALGQLEVMTQHQGQMMDDQNKQLDRINDKTKSVNEKTKKQISDLEKLNK